MVERSDTRSARGIALSLPASPPVLIPASSCMRSLLESTGLSCTDTFGFRVQPLAGASSGHPLRRLVPQ